MMKKILVVIITLAIKQIVFSQDTSAVKTQVPVLMPGMAGPLLPNPVPQVFKTGFIGDVYVSGAISSFFQMQNGILPGDKKYQADICNSQVFIQKPEGILQFFIQVGSYSIPAVGIPYFRAVKATDIFYGILPQGYLKIAPSKNFSVLAGKLPTMIGAEYTFSFENMNIQRGLLWNQENAVNRGLQLNYSKGPLTLALSGNDGYYSKKYNWLWGSATYAINTNNTIALIGGGNTGTTTVSTLATPLYQNNQQIYNLIYTCNTGHFTILPYAQYSTVPHNTKLGTAQHASSYSGAIFVKYGAPASGFSLPLRLEYIHTTGTASAGAPNLLYGPGSNAWSVTLTPTYQHKRFFGRTEFSYVQANNITPGFAFGAAGDNKMQTRLILEIGMLF